MKGWILGGVALLLAGIGYWAVEWRPYVRTNDAFIDGDTLSVSSDILARLTALYVDEGDVVEEGQLLCALDDSILLPKKEAAQAKVDSRQAAVSLEELRAAKVKDDYERAVKAFEGQIISAQQFDHAQKDWEIACARLELARKDLELAAAALEVADAALGHTKIVAPRKGAIVKRWVLPGDVMHQGQSIFALYDLAHIWVTANLLETEVAAVQLGSSAEIFVDAYPGYTFHGEVYVIKGAAASQFSLIPPDNATGNYTKVDQRVPVKISLRPPDDFPRDAPLYLFPGMSAEVRIRAR
jgi:membrane fusion protein (multidrug efflux system)